MREWICKVTPAGHLPGKERLAIDDCIRGLGGKQIVVKVAQYAKPRSNPQNRYYWGVVIPAITEMFVDAGNYVDHQDVHEFLKLRVGKLAQVFVTKDGEVMKGLGSTAKMTTVKFEEYLTKVRAFAAEYGVQIAEPNEEVA